MKTHPGAQPALPSSPEALLKKRILEARMTEMEAREEIVKHLRELNLGARHTKQFCIEELDYKTLEAKSVLAELGFIVTDEEMTSPNPTVRLKIEKLKTWRRERARENGVPAYRVLSNRALLSAATQIIRNTDELKGIKGVGAKKIERFGREILKVLESSGLQPN